MNGKRLLALALAAAAALVAGLAPALPALAQGFEQIQSYDVDLRIERDGTLLVTERIEYDFGSEQRHGIFRDIPVRFRYDDVHDRVYPVEVLDVEGSPGTPAGYQLEEEGPLLRIRIGDPDRTITGLHSYTITYRVQGALNAFPDHDELYWNAIGTDWTAPILVASARVTAPAPIAGVGCFAGPSYSTMPCESTELDGDTASFAHSGLDAFGGLTVVVGFSKGAVPVPRPILVERWSLARAFSVTPLALGLFGVLLLAGVAVIGWLVWVTGRDRRAVGGAVAVAFAETQEGEQRVPLFEDGDAPVEYEPPDGIRPGQVGVLVDESVDPVDVTATIVDLAVRGYLRIEEIPKRWVLGKPDWQLVKLREADGDLLRYEALLLNGLFQLGAEDDEETLKLIRAELQIEDRDEAGALQADALPPRPEEAMRSEASTVLRPSSYVTLSSLRRKFHLRFLRVRKAMYGDAATRKWFAARPDRVRQAWALRGGMALVAGIALTALAAWKTHYALVALPIPLAGLALLLGARWMPRRTARGTGLARRVLGFRRFMEESAEGLRAEFAERKNLFSEYLPYAIVFGLTEKWARAFAPLGEMPQTNWYVGSHPFSPVYFSSAIDTFALSAVGSLASRPAASGSSGFGGGGFSGGGGGGGGGGSW